MDGTDVDKGAGRGCKCADGHGRTWTDGTECDGRGQGRTGRTGRDGRDGTDGTDGTVYTTTVLLYTATIPLILQLSCSIPQESQIILELFWDMPGMVRVYFWYVMGTFWP